MKLNLSKMLLLAVMACYTHVQAATIDLTQYSWTGSDTFSNTDLQLSSNVTIKEDEEYLSWYGSGSGDYTWSGSGTLTFSGDYDLVLMISGNSNFTIEKGITIKAPYSYIQISGGANLILEGTINKSGTIDSANSDLAVIEVCSNSTFDVTDATLNNCQIFINQGTVIADTLTVNSTCYLELDSAYNGYSNAKVQGNLCLNGGVVVMYGYDHDYSDSYLTVTGTLSVTGSTKFLLWNSDWDGDSLSSTIESGTVFMYADEITGTLSKLSVYEATDAYDMEADEYIEGEPELITDMHFVSVLSDNEGLYALTLVSGSASSSDDPIVPDTSDTPDTVITDGGIAPETLDIDTQIIFGGSGEVDATGVLEGLSNKYISGTSGTLITDPSSTFEMTGVDELGYNIVGSDGAAGANITVGEAGGSITGTVIKLSGDSYLSDDIHIISGLLETASNTTLGLENAKLTIGVSDATGSTIYASVNNAGTIKSDVTLYAGASMDNRGIVEGDITMEALSVLSNNGEIAGSLIVKDQASVYGSGVFETTTVYSGGSLHIGNSPGYQYHESLTLNDGSNLSFSVSGTTAASLTSYGEGTYSYLEVGSLTIGGTCNVSIEIDYGVLSAGTEEFTITLLDADTLVTVDAVSILDVTLIDSNALLESSSYTWDATTGELSLTGQVSASAIAALVGTDGSNIANALWSSTSVVKSFAQVASSQLKMQQNGKTNVWASALGDFMSMSGSSSTSGFSYNGGGYAVGADYSITQEFRLGLAFGQTFGKFESDDNQASIDQDSLMAGLYSNFAQEISKTEMLQLSAFFAYGTVDNDADTYIGNMSNLPGSADWTDTVFTFGVKAALDMKLDDTTTLTPFIGLEYIHGDQEDFTETFDNGQRQYSDGNMQVWSMPIGVTLKKQVELSNGQILLPELTMAYIGDISRNNPKVNSSIYGINNTHSGSNPGRSAFMLSVGTNWLINESWSVGASYMMEARSEQFYQSASISARYSF